MPFSENSAFLEEKPDIIFIGCGISGATGARMFTAAGYKVVVLEKEERVGGKIWTQEAEMGAVVFLSNYLVVDTLVENKMRAEGVFAGDRKSINYVLYGKENPTWKETINFATHFGYEFAKYTALTSVFDYKNDDRNFLQFLTDHNCLHLARFLELWVPGMGYGPLDVIPARRALNYSVISPFNILAMASGLFGDPVKHVHGGYQRVIEKMVEGYDVRLSVHIEKIVRNSNGVSVTFRQRDGESQTLEASKLALTMSPYWWEGLPMELTPLEKRCAREVESVRYPVLICNIKNFPRKQVFKAHALKKEGLGHVGFIHTHDDRENPPEGRRCVVYVNLSKDDRSFSLDEGSAGRASVLEDLQKMGYPEVNIIATKVWEDYNPSLPKETSDLLEEAQGQNSTYYYGTYSKYSYETVADAEVYARLLSERALGRTSKCNFSKYFHSALRTWNFFHLPEATNLKMDAGLEMKENKHEPLGATKKLEPGF